MVCHPLTERTDDWIAVQWKRGTDRSSGAAEAMALDQLD